jgi:hypothetical protein
MSWTINAQRADGGTRLVARHDLVVVEGWGHTPEQALDDLEGAIYAERDGASKDVVVALAALLAFLLGDGECEARFSAMDARGRVVRTGSAVMEGGRPKTRIDN